MFSSVQGSDHSDDSTEFEHTLASIAERIREQQERRRKVTEALAGLRSVSFDGVEGIVETYLVNDVEMDSLENLTVAGVDGGLLEQQLHGLDLILIRAIAAIFHYHNALLVKAEYVPNEVPSLKLIDVSEPLDAREFERKKHKESEDAKAFM